MMKNLVVCLAILFFACCYACNSESQNKHLKYQNIVIISDMSNRLEYRPQKDIHEIHKLLQFFRDECVKPGEKIGDKSSISFSVFSEKTTASIDIDHIKNLEDKQRFINSTEEYKNNGLEEQIRNFENTIKKIYDSIRNKGGLDLISLLIEKINNEPIIKQDIFLTDGIDTTFINYENHIYIFSDGYLEYKDKGQNSQFYFSTPQIEKVRQYCKMKRVVVTKALEAEKSLCLPSYNSKKNQYINLHILETHERDKNLNPPKYNHYTGQRDNEILEAVWQKWAIESGFKSFEWKKY